MIDINSFLNLIRSKLFYQCIALISIVLNICLFAFIMLSPQFTFIEGPSDITVSVKPKEGNISEVTVQFELHTDREQIKDLRIKTVDDFLYNEAYTLIVEDKPGNAAVSLISLAILTEDPVAIVDKMKQNPRCITYQIAVNRMVYEFNVPISDDNIVFNS